MPIKPRPNPPENWDLFIPPEVLSALDQRKPEIERMLKQYGWEPVRTREAK